jgi:hypothetical protein
VFRVTSHAALLLYGTAESLIEAISVVSGMEVSLSHVAIDHVLRIVQYNGPGVSQGTKSPSLLG